MDAGESCCSLCLDNRYENEVQTKLDSTMPWIGMYVAVASAACSLAMAADAFNGFRRKWLWFPSKYFSLNAFSLTVLAVTMKLPVDLTSFTIDVNDKLARISSLVLMSTAIGNFMTSLGSMENNEIILNIAALCILVITVAGNVCIHIVQMSSFSAVQLMLAELVGSVVIMVLLLVMQCCMAVVVTSAKRYIESKYIEMHRRISNKPVEWGNFTFDELKVFVKRYWVMAATGNPQFVMARSVISGTSGLLCLLVALTLVEAPIRLRKIYYYRSTTSSYKWSINWILYIQSIGVAFGTIAPLMRWFLATRFKVLDIGRKSMSDEFKIETFWTSTLVEWRESSLPLKIQHYKCRKLLHDAKRLVLNIFIGVQVLLVLASKLVLLISAKFGNAIFLCFHHLKNLKTPDSMVAVDVRGLESTARTELEFTSYVLLLEGEAELPEKILKNVLDEVDKLIRIGEQKQPENLIKLLKKSANVNGVRKFDNKEVPSLHSQEPPNCWSLPVVTLTSIAVALPNVAANKVNQLLRGISEGLPFIKLIEKTTDKNGRVESIRNAAHIIWVGVELYKKWQDKDLQSTSLHQRTDREVLDMFSDTAEKAVKDFMNETKDILMENPLNWPVKVIAANSMYRITRTILLDNEQQSDEELFEILSIMISDILAACFTNLVRVINLKCYLNTLYERPGSVSRAAILLGESREILEILQQRDIPNINPEAAANIDEWRAFMDQDGEHLPT